MKYRKFMTAFCIVCMISFVVAVPCKATVTISESTEESSDIDRGDLSGKENLDEDRCDQEKERNGKSVEDNSDKEDSDNVGVGFYAVEGLEDDWRN